MLLFSPSTKAVPNTIAMRFALIYNAHLPSHTQFPFTGFGLVRVGGRKGLPPSLPVLTHSEPRSRSPSPPFSLNCLCSVRDYLRNHQFSPSDSLFHQLTACPPSSDEKKGKTVLREEIKCGVGRLEMLSLQNIRTLQYIRYRYIS